LRVVVGAASSAPTKKSCPVGVNLMFTLATRFRPINLEIRFWVARELRVENGNESSRCSVLFGMMDEMQTVKLRTKKRV
jgi:hypothetical protein